MLRAHLPWLRRMLEVDSAEARGDAAGALALMEDMPIVLAALGGELPVADEETNSSVEDQEELRPLASLVAAALLEPGTVDAVTPMLVTSDAARLRVLADQMPSPADLVCRRLADGLATAA